MRRRLVILAALLALAGLVAVAVTGWKPRIQYLDTSAGDYELTVENPTGLGTATITGGAVTGFHLTANGDANGQQINNIADGQATGDAVAYGQAVAGTDFTGTLPNPTLVAPVLRASGTIAGQTLSTGDCSEASVTVTGATTGGMVATVTPVLEWESGLVAVARVSALNTVAVRLCAIAGATTSGRTVDVSVLQ